MHQPAGKGKPSGKYMKALILSCNLILVHANLLNRGGESPIERVDWLNLDLCVDGFREKINTAEERLSMAA